MKFSDTVKRVGELSTVIDRYWDTELRKRHPKYPIVENDDDGPPPPEEGELYSLLRSLPTDELYRLMAIRRVGQGNFGPTEFAAALRDVEAKFHNVEHIIARFVAGGFVDLQLTRGEKALESIGVNMDHLHLVAA